MPPLTRQRLAPFVHRWLVLALVVGAAHASGFHGKFLFDDGEAIFQNPSLERIGFSAPDQSPIAGRPVVTFSLSIDHALWGKDPRGYHVVNIALHILNALLVAFLVQAALSRSGLPASELSLGAALIWGVHPLQTEAVTYLTQRTELLVTLFILLTLTCLVRAARAPSGAPSWSAAAIASAVLACGSKEIAVIIPVLAVLYDRAFLAASWREVFQVRGRLHTILAISTWLLIVLVMLQGHRSESVGTQLGVGVWDYLKSQAWAIARYARLAVWPDALSLDYGPQRTLALSDVILPGSLILGTATLAVIAMVCRPALGFWALLPFIALAPTSTFVPIVTEFAAERRVYLALLGPVVLGVILVHRLAWRWVGPARGLAVQRTIGVALVATLGVATFLRGRDYHEPFVIWADTVRKHPQNARAHSNLARELLLAGRPEEAVAGFERTLALDPSNADSRYYLSVALLERGDHARAADHLAHLIGKYPSGAQIEFLAGMASELADRPAAAIDYYRRMLAIDPGHVLARSHLAWLLATCPDAGLRSPSESVTLMEPLFRQDPRVPLTRDTLAAAYGAVGRFEDAFRVLAPLREQVRLRVQREPSEVAVEMLRMLDARWEHFAREQPYVDLPGHGVPRYQGRLRTFSVDFTQ